VINTILRRRSSPGQLKIHALVRATASRLTGPADQTGLQYHLRLDQ
jgi:hypothetical protein